MSSFFPGRCIHAFVTARPNPRVRFERAIKTRSVVLAEDAAYEMERLRLGLNLHEALQLVYLYGEADSPKYERAALRWLKRWIEEDTPPLADVAATACSFVEKRGFLPGAKPVRPPRFRYRALRTGGSSDIGPGWGAPGGG